MPLTRTVVGRGAVVPEIRAAAALMAALRAPIPARGPWLTAVLNTAPRWPRSRPMAVVVEEHPGRPDAVAFLELRRRGLTTVVSVLGATVPVPGGRPPARLLARDEQAAGLLAAGVRDLLGTLRPPWALELSGLPLGDPTARALSALLPTSVLGNVRSTRLVDELDESGSPVLRTRDPHVLDSWLPALLAGAATASAADHVRAAARLHAAIGQLELAVVTEGDELRAGLLTLLDGEDRWPWWGTGEGLRAEMGAPLVGLTVPGTGWSSRSALRSPAAP